MVYLKHEPFINYKLVRDMSIYNARIRFQLSRPLISVLTASFTTLLSLQHTSAIRIDRIFERSWERRGGKIAANVYILTGTWNYCCITLFILQSIQIHMYIRYLFRNIRILIIILRKGWLAALTFGSIYLFLKRLNKLSAYVMLEW